MVEEKFLEWKSLDETKKFYNYLRSVRSEILDRWAKGDFTAESAEGTAQLNASAMGKIQAIDEILELTHDWL